MNTLLNNSNEILIISGEGERGTVEVYGGERSESAIKQRLTKERCGGERWARAQIFHGLGSDGGKNYIDLETGEYRCA